MKGGAFTLVLVAGATPILVFALLVFVPTLHPDLASWEPPLLWNTDVAGFCDSQDCTTNAVTGIYATSTGLYATGFVRPEPYPGVCRPGYQMYCPDQNTTNYVFLNSYDFNGHEVWSIHLPGNGTTVCTVLSCNVNYDEIHGLSVGTDALYIVGSFLNNSAFVERRNLTGNTVWTRLFEAQAPTVSVGSGEVFVDGGNKLFVYNIDGDSVWNKTLVSVTSSTIYAGPGGLYVAGIASYSYDTQAFVSKYDPSGTLLWNQQFDQPGFTCSCYPNALSGDSSGTYVSGHTLSAFPGHSLTSHSDEFVRKYDLNGNLLWTTQSGTPDLSDAGDTTISANPAGVYLLVMRYNLVMRYDGNGNRAWSVALPADIAFRTMSAGTDRVYVGGERVILPARKAVIISLGQSSSLILFGVNSPFSFLLAGLMAATLAVSTFWLGRKLKKKRARPTSATRHDSRKVPSDPTLPVWKPA